MSPFTALFTMSPYLAAYLANHRIVLTHDRATLSD
jgi:hypothetical protein